MRGARAAILCLLAALALPGCMRTAGPIASTQTQSDLDSFAYGQSYAMAPTPAGYAAAPKPVAFDAAYRLDAGGAITMPLIGAVAARGRTPSGLAAEITGKLRNGYIRDPSVAVEIESYRPFFILGEVAAPGQYPYVPNMSVESAVAIAGGFSPRDRVTLTHTDGSGSSRVEVPLGTALSPGDTILVGERWF